MSAFTTGPQSLMLASAAVPPSQNTAPVIEFRCLYTSDLRRKQKRWQDGRLKFHTFNKRVMVYDERSNFVGDTHWKEDYEFNEGEELELERGGMLVQVADCIGRRDQDLTELLEKRVKEREGRVAARIAASSPIVTPVQTMTVQPATVMAGTSYLRPKSLNALLTPSGYQGRAVVLTTTPFEQRQRAMAITTDENCTNRPTKRRKVNLSPPNKGGYAQNLTGATLSLSAGPTSLASLRTDALEARKLRDHHTFESIDLVSSPENGEATSPVVTPGHERNTSERSLKKQRQGAASPKRGYAKTITGAVLTLTSGPTAQGKVTLGLSRFESRTSLAAGNTEMASINDFMKIDDLDKEDGGRISITAARKVAELTPKITSRQPSQLLPSAKFSQQPPTTATSRKSDQPSETANKDGQPSQPLRIKPRAKRSKLILYARPTPLPSVSFNGEIERTPLPSFLPADGQPEEPLLSQATRRLDAFSHAQSKRLQERLVKSQTLGLGDCTPSPDDIGIGHEEVDTLPSMHNMRLPGTDMTYSKSVMEPKHVQDLGVTQPASISRKPALLDPKPSIEDGGIDLERRFSGSAKENCSVEQKLINNSGIGVCDKDISEITPTNYPRTSSTDLGPEPDMTENAHCNIACSEVNMSSCAVPPEIGPRIGSAMTTAGGITQRNGTFRLENAAEESMRRSKLVPSFTVDEMSMQKRKWPQLFDDAAQLPQKNDDLQIYAIDGPHRLVLQFPSAIGKKTAELQNALLANPATRGKKAAQKCDYAGKTPVITMPSAMAVMGPSSASVHPRRSRRSISNAERTITESVSREKVGPWSKESADLFDWRRPDAAAVHS